MYDMKNLNKLKDLDANAPGNFRSRDDRCDVTRGCGSHPRHTRDQRNLNDLLDSSGLHDAPDCTLPEDAVSPHSFRRHMTFLFSERIRP